MSQGAVSLSPDRLAAANALLFRHWRDGACIDALPAGLRPANRAEGYAIQAQIEALSAHTLFGWKIAATSAAGQAHIGVDGPLAGRLLAERVIENGGACRLGANRMKVAELEFAFRMARDLAPRPAPFSIETVLDHVATLHPAIEIPDSRYRDFEHAGAPQLIADNACAHLFLLGDAAPEGWRALDLAAHPVQGRIGDGPLHRGGGANVLGDPRIALTWLANELSTLGITLAAGSVVTTGACVAPIAIKAGDFVSGDFGEIGKVSLSFVA